MKERRRDRRSKRRRRPRKKKMCINKRHTRWLELNVDSFHEQQRLIVLNWIGRFYGCIPIQLQQRTRVRRINLDKYYISIVFLMIFNLRDMKLFKEFNSIENIII